MITLDMVPTDTSGCKKDSNADCGGDDDGVALVASPTDVCYTAFLALHPPNDWSDHDMSLIVQRTFLV